MSAPKKPPGETAQMFLARKYLEYRKLLDDALEAGALASPIKTEIVEQTPNGGFQSVIKVSFSIMEYKLHEFRTKKS